LVQLQGVSGSDEKFHFGLGLAYWNCFK